MPQVSIIVLTYNCNEAKLRATLTAAALQKGISVEIIISDDGSARKDFSFLPEFFQKLGFSSWKLVENPENRGTVANCCAGLAAASGEYVFLTSPGDILFDSSTMQQFYEFATSRQADLCFGNAVCYGVQDGQVKRTKSYTIPAAPQVYCGCQPLKKQKRAFFGNNFIIGACYFRSLSFARESFAQLLDVSKYMEDTPSTMFALAKGIALHYLDRNIVFYEDGTGVSTGVNEKWQQLLRQDLVQSLEKLHGQNPKDPYIQVALNNISQTSRWKRTAYRFLRHPVISLGMLTDKKLKKPKEIPCSLSDLQRLQTLLNESTI